MVGLAVTNGATDAIGFLALGSTFTSVMTGNMVLLGVGAAGRDGAWWRSAAVAILSFVAGAAIEAQVEGAPPRTTHCGRPPVTIALYIELALFVALAA